ncbi:MAG: LuxR C-terminal-related transcriptional regulator [bacterium]|nr:LuxR C-terminal-related transcriptional regulator [bacterium]
MFADNGSVLCAKKVVRTVLTPREKEVLELMSLGKSNNQIAKALTISPHTAKAHVGHILEKFCAHDRVLAVVKAINEGLL